jgi:ribosome biogenesis GTPase
MSHDHLEASSLQGLVIKKTIGQYCVQAGNRNYICKLSNRLHKELVYPTADTSSLSRRVVEVRDIHSVDPVAVGDVVTFWDAGAGTGMITAVLPRRNRLSRMAAGTKPLEQVLAANVDQILAVFAAARPAPKWNLLDRYLLSAEEAGIPVIVAITKMDLAGKDELSDLEIYEGIGYSILRTSSLTGQGIPELRGRLAGKISVLMGKSGVGKTSLLNAIQPGLGLRISAVSQGDIGKGRHTTAHIEMVELEGNGKVIDTPGMREFGLWERDNQTLANLFPEMRPYLGRCRFGQNCQHQREPGCAVRSAVDQGAISQQRYASYVKLYNEG